MRFSWHWGFLGFLGVLGFAFHSPAWFGFFAFFLFFLEPVARRRNRYRAPPGAVSRSVLILRPPPG